jgi:predicted phosphodiesterase
VRYLVISDIHGNRHAIEAVTADARAFGFDAVVCLGDLVGYGADPAAAIDLTLALEPVALIRGNHDKVCAGLEPATLFNDVARHSIEWTRDALSPAHLKLLRNLPKGPRLVTDALEICHGAPFDEDHYVFDGGDAARAIDAASARICLFGHTHLPAIFATAGDPARAAETPGDDAIGLPHQGPVLINVGSVGQPRDGDPRAAYGVIDLERNVIYLRRVAYDVEGAQKRILGAGLPAWLAMRLGRGQ